MATWWERLEETVGLSDQHHWVAIYSLIAAELARSTGGDAALLGTTAVEARLHEAQERLSYWRARNPVSHRVHVERTLTARWRPA